MTNYLSVPVIEEFVHLVEDDSQNEDFIKAMAAGILTHYFLPLDGFVVAPKHNDNHSISHFWDLLFFAFNGSFPATTEAPWIMRLLKPRKQKPLVISRHYHLLWTN